MNRSKKIVPRLLCMSIGCALASAAVAAVAADGDIDVSYGSQGARVIAFDYGGDKADTPEDLITLVDGGYLVAGRARKPNGFTAAVSARLNSGGQLESAYGVGGKRRLFVDEGQDQAFTGVAQLPDGRLVLAGFDDVAFSASNQRHQAMMVLADEGTAGVADVQIDAFPNVTTEFTGVTVDALGRAVGTGIWQGANDDSEFHAKRYLPSLLKYDTGYALSGDSIIPLDLAGQGFDASTAAVHLPDGTLLQGGFAQLTGTDYDFAVVRSLQNGDLDDQQFGIVNFAFDIPGSNLNDRVRAMLIDPQGRVLIAGEAARGANGFDTDLALVRLKSNLQVDGDFGDGGRLVISFDLLDVEKRDLLGGIAIAPDGKILIVGTHFTGDPANVSDVGVIRLKDDGDADFTFGAFGRELYDFGGGATQRDVGVGIVADQNRAVVLSQREFSGLDTDFVTFGIVNTVPPLPAPLFKNGFE